MYNLFILAVLGFSALSSVTSSGSLPYGQHLSSGNSSILPLPAFCDGSNCDNYPDQLYGLNASRVDSNTVLERRKRRVLCLEWCEWQCRDGTCIPLESKCDGVVDCPDRSDETHAVCRNMVCQDNWFRCTYGACVTGSAPCNGIQECADDSDELLPRCRNETVQYGHEVKCADGQLIPSSSRCDGVADCRDRSDEALATCADMQCPSYYFQCAYGACVDHGADCDGKIDCIDGSDEDDVLCNKTMTTQPHEITQQPNDQQPIFPKPQPIDTGNKNSSNGCILPPYPEHGTYVGDGPVSPGASIGDGRITVSCAEGYRIIGESDVICFDGQWLKDFPKCARFCKMIRKTSMEFRCVLTGDSHGTRKCEDYEPVGTQVTNYCAPNYRPDGGDLGYMICREHGWANVPRCLPECGTVTPFGVPMIIGGRSAKKGELPWHTGIYAKWISIKTSKLRHMQICGGSLISTTIVLSAAHCFWGDNQLRPANNFTVALGKLYRNWDKPEDDVQKSDVKKIYIIPQFMGNNNQYQGDIAMLQLASVIQYKPHIRPVCMDFDHGFAKEQLHAGNMGKVAGWGEASTSGAASKMLKVVELPYVEPGVCKEESLEEFKSFVTVDKFCAGYKNGTAMCRGDSGGGLVFRKKGTGRYYIRGIVSTAHHNDYSCNTKTLTTFTNVLMYEDFIKEHWHIDDN